jgi:hypothetical protein
MVYTDGEGLRRLIMEKEKRKQQPRRYPYLLLFMLLFILCGVMCRIVLTYPAGCTWDRNKIPQVPIPSDAILISESHQIQGFSRESSTDYSIVDFSQEALLAFFEDELGAKRCSLEENGVSICWGNKQDIGWLQINIEPTDERSRTTRFSIGVEWDICRIGWDSN